MPTASLQGASLDLPENWRGVQAIWVGPARKQAPVPGPILSTNTAGFRDSISLHVHPGPGVTAMTYLAATIQNLDQVAIKVEPVEEGESARCEIQNNAPGGVIIRQFLFATKQSEDEIAMLTYSFLEGQGDLKEQREFFQGVIASLNIG